MLSDLRVNLFILGLSVVVLLYISLIFLASEQKLRKVILVMAEAKKARQGNRGFMKAQAWK